MNSRTIARLALAVALAEGAAWCADAALPPLVHQAGPGVYYRQSEDQKRIIATTSWIEFDTFVVVIDANFPWGADAIVPDIRKTTTKPIRFVFDTHYHADHSYGNGVFAELGATVISSDQTAAESRDRNSVAWARNKDTGMFDLKQYKLVHPQVTFSERAAIEEGGRRLEFIRMHAAHTAGNSVAWLPRERILFTGDLCTTRAQNNLSDPNMDIEGWIGVLSELESWNPRVVIPGHGVQGTAETLRGQRSYLAAILDGVKAGVARGETVERLEKEIDFTAHKPWSDSEQRNTAVRAVYEKLKKPTP